jgi:heat shock protein HslJ
MRFHLLLLPLALAACASTSTAIAQDATLLGGYHWQLTQATDRGGRRIDALFVRPDKPLQLDFADGRLSVRNACNGAGGSYRIANGQLVVGPMMHTMMACANRALNQLDGQIGLRLASHPAITVTQHGDTPQLQLRTATGDTLDFTGVPTPETRYGGPGVTEFLEVAARTVPCAQNQACLKVREVHYDANGLKTGTPGVWHALPAIEGYTHQDGVHNVVRVKRYADGKASTAYVLDTVVESSIPKP